jgi:hypothetical protein
MLSLTFTNAAGLASAVILRSGSRRTHDHILQSQIRTSSTWGARSPYLYPPRTGWPSYTPDIVFPFRRLLRLARLRLRIGHMHIYIFLLRIADNLTSENIDLSSWNTLYIVSQTIIYVEINRRRTRINFIQIWSVKINGKVNNNNNNSSRGILSVIVYPIPEKVIPL